MTSPAYLRDLALKFAATQRPRDLAIAERLRAIADELDIAQATDEHNAIARAGVDLINRRERERRAIDQHLQALHATPALTPAQLEELRNLRKAGKL